MKILLFAEYYPNYLKDFYRKRDVSHLSYSEHLSALLDDYFAGFGSYTRHLAKRGHDAELIIGNDYLLQNKWLRERGIKKIANPGTKKDIVLLQVAELKPEMFFMGSMLEYYGDFLSRVSQVTDNIVTWLAAAFPKNLDFSHIKCVISSVDSYVTGFRSSGLNSEKLKAAFDPDIAKHLDDKKSIEVSFVGGLSRRSHGRRVQGLEYVLKHDIDLKVFGYGLRRWFIPFLETPLVKSYMGRLWGMDMYRVLNHSKISLNFHIDFVKNWAGNNRIYEATGSGTMLMTEKADRLDETFDVGREVVVYDSLSDLVDKIKYYLSHDQERELIAKAGQNACLQRHGFDTRIIEMENIFYKYAD